MADSSNHEENARFDEILDSKIKKGFQIGGRGHENKWMALLLFQGFMCIIDDPLPCIGDPCYQQSFNLL